MCGKASPGILKPSHGFACFLPNPELLKLKLKVQEPLTVMLTALQGGPSVALPLSNQSACGGGNVLYLFVFNLLIYQTLDFSKILNSTLVVMQYQFSHSLSL